MNQSGVQKYSPGVLVGNWYEEQQNQQDQVALYRSQKAKAEAGASMKGNGTLGGGASVLNNTAANQELLKSHLMRASDLSDEKSGPVRFGEPLLIVNVKTKSTLALDLATPVGGNLSAIPVQSPQVRNTWVLQRSKDTDNAAFNSLIKEPNVLHYGQRVRLSNEGASDVGFLYIHAELSGGIGSSEGQTACVRYTANTDNIFIVVHPNRPRGHVLDGTPVELGQPVGLVHSITNLPLCVGGKTQRTSFGVEPKVTCEYALERHSRSMGAIVSQEENLFYFTATGSATAPSIRGVASLNSTGARSLNKSGTRSAGAEKAEDLIQQIREKLLYQGGRLGFRTVSRALGVSTKEHRTTYISRQQLVGLVSQTGLRLTPGEVDIVMKACDHDGDTRVSAQEFLAEMRGNMPPTRMQAVALAYQSLVVEGEGSVEFIDMYNLYRVNASQHPDVLDGIIRTEEAVFDFENSWPGRVNMKIGTVTENEFIEYYNDISPTFDTDERFLALIANCWAIPATKDYQKGEPTRVVSVVHTDDSTEQVLIPDSLVIDLNDFDAVRRMLISRGIKDIRSFTVNTRSINK